MRFLLKIFFHQFIWSIIFGIVLGIVGVSWSIIKIADFYLLEGTDTRSNIQKIYIKNSEAKPLNNDSLSELRNIEGVAYTHPYFSPTEDVLAGINYLGFTASYPIKIKGIPQLLGLSNVVPAQRNTWGSVDLDTIPVLLPQQAVNIYNNMAPVQGWPSLNERAFIGLPGTVITIQSNQYTAVISGFDSSELGNVVIAPAQKLFTIYSELGLDPKYDSIEIESVEGLNRQQIRSLNAEITKLGYAIGETARDNFQVGLFTRIKYTVALLGFGILLAFVLLKIYIFLDLLRSGQAQIWLNRVWGLHDFSFFYIVVQTIFMSVICGGLSWIVSFFGVVPAQEYIIDVIKTFGFNTPSLKSSVQTAFETGFLAIILFLSISLGNIFYFFSRVRKSSYIKKF